MSPNRTCGHCAACCVIPEIKDGAFDKPACKVCPFLKHPPPPKPDSSKAISVKGSVYGCQLFGQPTRPQFCTDYLCAWMKGYGNLNDRPDKNGIMVSINTFNGGRWIIVMNLTTGAHLTTGKRLIIDLTRRFNLPVIVVERNHLKSGTGDYVIIKKNLESRSSKIKGKFIRSLTKELKIYELIATPPPTSQRRCGDCHACCTTFSIKQSIVHKPACQPCPFYRHGCQLYGDPRRPQVCAEYYCAWIQGHGNASDRPDQSHCLVTIETDQTGPRIIALDLVPNAHLTSGKPLITEIAAKSDLPIIIGSYDNLIYGKADYVVIKRSLEKSSSHLKGDFIAKYTDTMNLYKLKQP